MSFEVGADAYAAFMGRFSGPLATLFADALGVGARLDDGSAGPRTALDVGCGTGALTGVLVERLGAADVAAVDPSAPFVEAFRARFPDVEVHRATAEQLPFDDGRFDLVTAQLVVHFMRDPVAGLREMGRVARPGGTVAASVWDHAGGAGPLALFWAAVRSLDPDAPDESGLAGAREGHLVELATHAGLVDAVGGSLTVEVQHRDFDDWWRPFTLGVGPAGDHVARLDDAGRRALEARCRELVPDGPSTTRATAWTVVARSR